jgi:hypothetical protein
MTTVRGLWRRLLGRTAAPPTDEQLRRLLSVLDHTAVLAPVADDAVRACGQAGDVPGDVGRTCGELVTAYQRLRAELHELVVGPDLAETADEVDRLLHYHQWLVRSALQLAFSLNPDPRKEAMRRRLDGLGPPAARLQTVRADVARRLTDAARVDETGWAADNGPGTAR